VDTSAYDGAGSPETGMTGKMVSETIRQFKNADNKLASTLPHK
jgi:hypothetical protein